MNRTLDLMVDIDDVVFPTMVSIHQLALQAGLHDGTARMDWTGWKNYTLPTGEPCTPEIYWDLWSNFALSNGYLLTEPIEGSAEALRWLAWEGHRIHLVTARGFLNHGEEIKAWTREWVVDFAIPHESLTFTKDKVQAMHDLGVVFDSAIDDHPKNYAALDAAGIRVYLQDHQHNEAADIPADRRVPNVWEWAYRIEKEFA